VTLGADYAADVLRSVPQGGTLIADGDNVFLLQYATQVLGERPDLTLYDRGGHVLRTLPPGKETALTEAAFLSWPGYEAPAGLRFRPHGLVYLLEREGPVASDADFWAEAHEARVRAQAARIGDLLGRTLAASYPILRGERALFEGDGVGAERRFEQARAIAGDSETVRNTLGTIYGRRGDLERAAQEFETALRLKPASPRAAANLRLVRRLQGR
jgi:tetratricopeptide (TPR) repeat protein